jgi:hypothetical protein
MVVLAPDILQFEAILVIAKIGEGGRRKQRLILCAAIDPEIVGMICGKEYEGILPHLARCASSNMTNVTNMFQKS